MQYSELLEANRQLKSSLASQPEVFIAVLSNVTIHPVRELLEYALRSQGIHAVARIGNFDNIVQDSAHCGDCRAVLIFWELAPILENLVARSPRLDDDAEQKLIESLTADVQLALGNLAQVPLVAFNLFSALPLAGFSARPGRVEKICREVNNAVQGNDTNVLRVDVDKIIAQVSIGQSIDWRLYYLTRSLYTRQFLSAYVDQIQPEILGLFGKRRKALILDCDNTLWKGIVGEDGLEGIELSPATPQGRVYREVQGAALALLEHGVILGLCSKNNPEDVDAVLKTHPDMLIRDEHLAIKRVNWQSKVSNLRSIAEELNIGLDSLVFVDDSGYELAEIREELPEVLCLQVPENRFQYPVEFRKLLRAFSSGKATGEDAQRTAMYHAETLRKSAADLYSSKDSFFKSLELWLRVQSDASRLVQRIAQLTQKTNQFNLTTIRYSEAEISQMLADPDWIVTAVEIEDRFGNYGLTGVALLRLEDSRSAAVIDTLLLSCRVLGREIEKALMDVIVEKARTAGARGIRARYRRTAKNGQVEDYYDRMGFSTVGSTPDEKLYGLCISDYKPFRVDFIRTEYA